MVLYERNGDDIDRGLIGYWKLDDLKLSGTTKAIDYSSNFNDGDINGGTNSNCGAFGPNNDCIDLDGTEDEYIDTNFEYDLSGSGNFSVSIWIKGVDPDYAISQSHTIDTYSSDWFIGYNSAIFWFRSKTLGNRALVEDNEWHHLVMVWDISAGTYEGFIDGESIGTSATVSGYGGVGTIKIGSRGDGTTSFYTGKLSNCRIYDRKLTYGEISKLHRLKL